MKSDYKMKFKIVKCYPLQRYLENDTVQEGTDMCIVIGIVDEEDDKYSDEAIEQISVPDLELPPKHPEMNFQGVVFGYPMEHISKKQVKENKPMLPYINKEVGNMEMKFENLGETASLTYKIEEVFTSVGQSGGPIFELQNGSYILKGVHSSF